MNKIVITILSVALGFISCKDDSTGEISKSDKLVLQIEAAELIMFILILIKIRTSIPEYLQ